MTTPVATNEMVLGMRAELDQVILQLTELQQFANATDLDALKVQIEGMFDTKIRTAIAMTSKPVFDGESSYTRPILESKAIQDVPGISDAKGYRSWNRKMKNAMEQVRTRARNVLELVEKMTEEEITNKFIIQGCTTKKESIVMILEEKYGHAYKDLEESLETANRDLWSILSAKSTGEAEEKMEGCAQGEGLWAYFRIHSWFTRTTAQGKSLRRAAIMNPARCKHEHEISAAIEKWEERYRILKEDDRELELPDSYRMTAIHGILCGEIQKSVEHREKEFQSYDELRSTVMK